MGIIDAVLKKGRTMLFKKIGIIDENYKYQPDMYVGTEGKFIKYIGSNPPEDPSVYGESYDGKGKFLLSAFYNAHGHSPMCLMRGYGENMTLADWLNTKIFPFESKLYSEAVYYSTLLTMAESIRFGIVSTSDMYYFLDDMVRAYADAGTKGNISRAVVNPTGDDPYKTPGYVESVDAFKQFDGMSEGKILIDMSIHAIYTNDEGSMRALADLTKELNTRMHVHLEETEAEAKEAVEKYGMTATEAFEKYGLFDSPCLAAHCVWLRESDMDILKAHDVTVASNPASNFKLASGICDVPKLYEKGINVAIGTDSVASNNSLNYIEQMKWFALIGKMKSGDPSAMKPEQVLFGSSRAGAIAQGRPDCGLLKEGFRADLVALDISGPNMNPVENIATEVIYSADGKDVCLTMADGELLYKDGEYMTIDIEKVIFETDKAKQKILSML